MWLKFILAILVGFILSSSFTVNLNLILPVPKDVGLFVGLIFGFLSWAGAMVYFVSFNKITSALLHSIKWLVPSIALNVFLLF
ncbi:MAG: hypothetical protein ABJK64_12630 [Paraglaciecola sp.]|uniref:hypothetical protein n=1 Tax=Paraglaciecola sp. TaxID=1920173 RepID=UPI003298C5BB